MEIIPILEGKHCKKEKPHGTQYIEGHTSSVTLIKTDGMNILVDAGGRGKINEITSGLLSNGLKCKEIDIVILTHFHLDHSYNIAYFDSAKIYGWRHEWKEGETILVCPENVDLPSGIKIMPTPGHTHDHISVIVEEELGKIVVIAGDAINEAYVRENILEGAHADKEEYKRSAQKILTQANKIIPGHGKQIVLNRKET